MTKIINKEDFDVTRKVCEEILQSCANNDHSLIFKGIQYLKTVKNFDYKMAIPFAFEHCCDRGYDMALSYILSHAEYGSFMIKAAKSEHGPNPFFEAFNTAFKRGHLKCIMTILNHRAVNKMLDLTSYFSLLAGEKYNEDLMRNLINSHNLDENKEFKIFMKNCLVNKQSQDSILKIIANKNLYHQLSNNLQDMPQSLKKKNKI